MGVSVGVVVIGEISSGIDGMISIVGYVKMQGSGGA